MKTIHEYEPADIDLKDPVYGFLMAQMLIVGLTGFKTQDDDPPDDATYPVKRLIANLLNHARKSGISITKSEVPAAFRA